MCVSLQGLLWRFAAAAGLAVCALACGTTLHGGWSSLPHSTTRIALTSLDGEALIFDEPKLARRGGSRILVLALGPNVALQPHHIDELKLPAPATIPEFGEHLAAPLLINGGMFNVQHEPLGLVRHNEQFWGQAEEPSWKGFVVGDAPAHLVDREYEPTFDTAAPQTLVQSMMLVDRAGQLRVRTTDRSASRTVLAEDARGRLLVVVTEGATTLAELGRWLYDGPLHVAQALNLDGGHESQLLLRTSELELTLMGEHGVYFSGATRRTLPLVLALTPKKN